MNQPLKVSVLDTHGVGVGASLKYDHVFFNQCWVNIDRYVVKVAERRHDTGFAIRKGRSNLRFRRQADLFRRENLAQSGQVNTMGGW